MSNIESDNSQNVGLEDYNNISVFLQCICRRESLKTSESIDSLKFLGNL